MRKIETVSGLKHDRVGHCIAVEQQRQPGCSGVEGDPSNGGIHGPVMESSVTRRHLRDQPAVNRGDSLQRDRCPTVEGRQPLQRLGVTSDDGFIAGIDDQHIETRLVRDGVSDLIL